MFLTSIHDNSHAITRIIFVNIIDCVVSAVVEQVYNSNFKFSLLKIQELCPLKRFIFTYKCTQMPLVAGLRPYLLGELTALTHADPLAGLRGRGGEWEREMGKGKEGRGREERGGRRKGEDPKMSEMRSRQCARVVRKLSIRGVARNLFFWGEGIRNFLGGIKLQYPCSIAVLTSFLPHKKFTWTDFGGIYTHIPPSLRP